MGCPARQAWIADRSARAARGGRVVADPAPRSARWRAGHRVDRVGAGARPRSRPATRRIRGADGGARGRHRRGRVRLRLVVLPAPTRRSRPVGGVADVVRRLDARAGPVRQPARALRLLGADDDHVVPPDRQQPHRWTCSCGSTPGALDHQRRSAGDAGRIHHPRTGGRHVPSQRAGRRSAIGDGRRSRAGARAGRGVHQVRPVPGARLVAGGDGRTHTGERIPALGHDGQGRCVPDRTPLPGILGRRFLAADRRLRRALHDGRGRASGAPPDRSQTAAGDGHGEPTRLHDRRARPGIARIIGGGLCRAARPRSLQGGGIHGGRHPRPSARITRHPPDPEVGRRLAVDGAGDGGVGGVDGGCAAGVRIRRQGIGVRGARRPERHRLARWRSRRR